MIFRFLTSAALELIYLYYNDRIEPPFAIYFLRLRTLSAWLYVNDCYLELTLLGTGKHSLSLLRAHGYL